MGPQDVSTGPGRRGGVVGGGILQGICAHNLCTCVQSKSLNVACPEVPLQVQVGMHPLTRSVPLLRHSHLSGTRLIPTVQFSKSFHRIYPTWSPLTNLHLSLLRPLPSAPMMHSASEEVKRATHFQPTIVPFFCSQDRAPWPTGSSLRCFQYFTLLCVLQNWIPFLVSPPPTRLSPSGLQTHGRLVP